MTKAIEILASLANDTTRTVDDLSADDLACIEALKAEAAEMNPIMTISEPSDPTEPTPDPEPEKNPKVA